MPSLRELMMSDIDRAMKLSTISTDANRKSHGVRNGLPYSTGANVVLLELENICRIFRLILQPGTLKMNSGSDSNERKQSTRSSRLRGVDSVTKKFLRDFDPQSSEREKRKLHRRLYPGSKKHVVYDERGFLIKTGLNLCDCLQMDCPGCHFPCNKCNSTKCGHECRNHRKWTYDSIENEGSDIVMKNINYVPKS